MKFTKLVCLLSLAFISGCTKNDNKDNGDYITCKNYNHNLDCYTDSVDDDFIWEMCNYLLHNGYENFIIRNDEGYIEFYLGDLNEVIR